MPTRYDGDFVSTWNVLEEFAGDGRARSIGVSNFTPAHLDKLAAGSDTVPAVNQIEVHPYFVNDTVRAYGQEHGIATEAWSPIAQGQVLDDPVSRRSLRHRESHRHRRCCAGTSSVVTSCSRSRCRPDRMKENFELFDFSLDGDEMAAISGLDRGDVGPARPDPDTFDWIPRGDPHRGIRHSGSTASTRRCPGSSRTPVSSTPGGSRVRAIR